MKWGVQNSGYKNFSFHPIPPLTCQSTFDDLYNNNTNNHTNIYNVYFPFFSKYSDSNFSEIVLSLTFYSWALQKYIFSIPATNQWGHFREKLSIILLSLVIRGSLSPASFFLMVLDLPPANSSISKQSSRNSPYALLSQVSLTDSLKLRIQITFEFFCTIGTGGRDLQLPFTS